MCSLFTIVLANLADITSLENNRAIASGNLLLKVLDMIILLPEGNRPTVDPLPLQLLQLKNKLQGKAVTHSEKFEWWIISSNFPSQGNILFLTKKIYLSKGHFRMSF